MNNNPSDASVGATSTPDGEACINMSIDHYDQGLDRLNKALIGLEERLIPILSPAYPSEPSPDVAEGRSTTHSHLIGLNSRLGTLNDFAHQITDRITL